MYNASASYIRGRNARNSVSFRASLGLAALYGLPCEILYLGLQAAQLSQRDNGRDAPCR